MIKFFDGVAAKKVLLLGRAPVFLRVVIDQAGKIDALDKVDDVPRLDEEIIVYERVGNAGSCHVSMTDRRKSGFYAIAEYRQREQQPEDHVMRDNEQWKKWCVDNWRKSH